TLLNASGERSARNAATSSGVGGRPMRSSDARRSSVILSARAAGRRCFASSSERTNASIGVRTHARFAGAGGVGRTTRWSDHHWRWASLNCGAGGAPVCPATAPTQAEAKHSVRTAAKRRAVMGHIIAPLATSRTGFFEKSYHAPVLRRLAVLLVAAVALAGLSGGAQSRDRRVTTLVGDGTAG